MSWIEKSLSITMGTHQILDDSRDSVPRSKYWRGRVPLSHRDWRPWYEPQSHGAWLWLVVPYILSPLLDHPHLPLRNYKIYVVLPIAMSFGINFLIHSLHLILNNLFHVLLISYMQFNSFFPFYFYFYLVCLFLSLFDVIMFGAPELWWWGALANLLIWFQWFDNTNPSPDPDRYRRRCPDPNARIQKFIHYMAIWQ